MIAPTVISRGSLFEEAKDYFNTRREKWEQCNRLDRKRSRRVESVESAERFGEQRMLFFEQILESGFGAYWAREEVTRRYHDVACSALAPMLLEEDYDRLWPLLSRTRGWRELVWKMALCQLPRRMGKSVATAQLVVALAEVFWFFPRTAGRPLKIGVYSNSQRVSNEMAEYVRTLMQLRDLPFKWHNQTNPVISLSSPEMSITVSFYPSSENSLRGTNAELIIIDEASFLNERVWNKIIVPLIGMESATVLMISSWRGGPNFFSQMINKTDKKGHRLFGVYSVELICRRCKLKPTEEKKQCRHLMHLLPRWKSPARLEMLEQLVQNDIEGFLMENYSISNRYGGAYFTNAMLKLFKAMPEINIETESGNPSYVLVCVDPNSTETRTSSEMACVAIGFSPIYAQIIMGMSTFRTEAAVQSVKVLRTMLDSIRQRPESARCPIFFCCERGTGQSHSMLADIAQRYPPAVCISQYADGKVGWRPTESSKLEHLNTAMRYVGTSAIRFLSGWNYENGLKKCSSKEMHKKLFEQLFRYGTYEGKNGHVRVSGRLDESGRQNPSLHDDLALAFCMTIGIMDHLHNRKVPNMPYSLMYRN